MSAKRLGWAIRAKCSHPLAKLILIILCDASDKNNLSFMAQATIAERAGVDRKTANRMLKVLENDGHIRRSCRWFDGMRSSDHVQVLYGSRCTSQVQAPVPNGLIIPSSPYGVRKEKKKGAAVAVPRLTLVAGTAL